MRLAVQIVADRAGMAGLGDVILDPINYAPLQMIQFRLTTDRLLQLRFLSGTTAVSASSIQVSAKVRGDFDGSFVMTETGFSLNGSLSSGYYEGYPNFNSTPLRRLFTKGLRYVDLDFDINWQNSTHVGVTMPIIARVWNNVVKGDEDPVTPGITGLNNSTGVINGPGIGITTVLDGGDADLDSIVTLGVSDRLIMIPQTNSEVGFTVWYLQSGTASDDPTSGIVRPLDYADSTNEKIWTGIL